MKKRLIKNLLLCLFVLFAFTTSSCKKNQDKVTSFPEIVNELNSYKLSGTLESNYPSGTKVSNVTVYYKKPDLYRVELVLPNSLEKQVIIVSCCAQKNFILHIKVGKFVLFSTICQKTIDKSQKPCYSI